MRAPAPVPLALLAALLAATLGQAGTASVEPTAWTTPPPPHPAIHIQGDAGFTLPASGVRGGTGTPEDPYRIADWSILRFSAYGIRLSGTRAHAVIDNIFLEGEEGVVTHRAECLENPTAFCLGPQGISLVNAENVTIRNVRIVASSYGVRAEDSARIRVLDSVFGSSTSPIVSLVNGVEVRNSAEVAVGNTHFLRVLVPFRAIESSQLAFEWNTVVPRASFDSTLVVRDTDVVRLSHNLLQRARLLAEGRTANLSVVENAFQGPWTAVEAPSNVQNTMTRILICGNRIEQTRGSEAIMLREAFDATIAHNWIVGGRTGVQVNSGSRVVFESNFVANHTDRGLQMIVTGAEVHGNHFEGNANGIRITRPANAALNWWGAPDGPSGDGPGSGQPLHRFGSGAVFSPWLTVPPQLPLDCDPQSGAGATPPSPAVLSAAAGARAGVAGHQAEGEHQTEPLELPW